MNLENKPFRQDPLMFKDLLGREYGFSAHIIKLLSASNIDSSNVITAVDLGCGIGVGTEALIRSLPKAQIHAVDYYPNPLDESLVDNPKITFHNELFIDILQSGILPSGGIILASNISRHHGFTHYNSHLLTSLVDDGHLITFGDNYHIEETTWFKDSFKIHHQHDPYSRVWKNA